MQVIFLKSDISFIIKNQKQMKHYLTTSGVLSARVVKYTEDYVFLEYTLKGCETKYNQLTKDSFDGLKSWVKKNYDVIYSIN